MLDCKSEPIEMLDNGTSIATIYDNDINNGAAINIGVNENVSNVTFYEADGTTNADAKFTLNPDVFFEFLLCLQWQQMNS